MWIHKERRPVTTSIMNILHVFISPTTAVEHKLVHDVGAKNSRVAFRSPLLIYPPLKLVSPRPLSPVKDSCQKPACYEKTVTLTKEPYDSLGMTVAGGMSSRGWDLPIYVTNVDSDGVVGQEGSIRKGNNEILMNSLMSHFITHLHAPSYNYQTITPKFYYKECHVQCFCANHFSFSGWSVCLVSLSPAGARIVSRRLSWIWLWWWILCI